MASKLQEMLAARKAEQNGQVISSQVVQPQTSAPKAPETSAKKLSVLDKLKRKSDPEPVAQSGPGNRVHVEPAITVVEQGPVIVKEETMPEGLSLLQKRKWIAEHAKSQSIVDNALASKIQSATEKTSVIENNVSSSPQAVLGNSVQKSASQSADDQKTNDGVANIAELKSNLKYLADNIENPELVKDVVRTIAMQIAQRPELAKHMLRGEVNLMVRGLRQSYNQAAMKKQEKSVGKKKVDKDVSELEDMMKGMGVSFKLK